MKKKKAIDKIEELDAMGQEDEIKAAKWVMEKGREDEKEEKETKAIAEEVLQDARRTKERYYQKLLEQAFRLIHTIELPTGYHVGAFYTKSGLVVWVTTPKKQWFAKGMKVSGEVKYDMNGVDRLLIKACDFIDDLEEKASKTEGGIYLK